MSCEVQRGYRRIDMPDSGQVTSGAPVYAVGYPDAPQAVSLGDSGAAVLQFNAPFYDGEGYDFAVFENGFGSGAEAFLEFAFVEVSSDGEHFFRFPAISEIQTDDQTGAFETTDASYVHNLAGKYTVNYGTPFDLADIPDTSLLDKSRVTHIRIVDVVGSVDPSFASYDQDGNMINDPWRTSFPSGGFDLDAVGIIHSLIPLQINEVSVGTPTFQNLDILGRNTNHSNFVVTPGGTVRFEQR